MKTKRYFVISVVLGLLLPIAVRAQAPEGDPSLGDLARSLRKSKPAPVKTVIDNDNMAQVMDEVESHRLGSGLLFSFDGRGKNFTVSSPDVTCSLSFNAQATSLLSDPYTPRELPDSEVAKLDGPATVSGDILQVSVYNGTAWNLREITVGLTILRPAEVASTAYGPVGPARLVAAAAGTTAPPADPVLTEKRSDLTVLYHLKGTAAPFTTTVFSETLGTMLGPNQDWHWAIVQAKGLPPGAQPTPPDPEQQSAGPQPLPVGPQQLSVGPQPLPVGPQQVVGPQPLPAPQQLPAKAPQ